MQKQFGRQTRYHTTSTICQFLVLVLTLTFVGAFAQTAHAQSLSKEQQNAVKEIANYINSISSIKGQFTQIGPRGRVSNGIFYIVKPGKMRFEYAAPNPFLVVSDGSWVYVKNRTRKRVDHYPLTATPLRLILDKKVNLFKETKIKSVEITPELTSVVLEDTSSFASGALKLIYDKAAGRLQQWVVIDDRGRRTSVSISNIENNISADPKLFKVDLKRKNRLHDENDR